MLNMDFIRDRVNPQIRGTTVGALLDIVMESGPQKVMEAVVVKSPGYWMVDREIFLKVRT